MFSEKHNLSIIAIILFLASLLTLSLNIFVIPANAGAEYNLDKLFYYSLNIIFWFSTPYLLSKIIRKIIWNSQFKDFIGTKFIGTIEDIFIVLVYLICLAVLTIKLFNLEFSAGLLLLIVITGALSIYLRPKYLNLTKAGFIQAARPFKIGDWVSLLSADTQNSLSGMVTGFGGQSIQLKTGNNTLLVVPDYSLTDFVIENYKALEKEVQFSMKISLSRFVPIEQAKRIFTAAARYALLKSFNTIQASPAVLVTGVFPDKIDYKINFSFAPWDPYSPETIKDLIFSTIVDQLGKAGIIFDRDDKHNIIEQVELFSNLDKKDLEILNSSAKSSLFHSGDILIRQEDEGSSMFILCEGLLKVSIKTDGSEDLTVGLIIPGEFFGEMSLFTGEKRSATVIADTDSVVLEITKEALKRILDKKPELIEGFGEIIAERQSRNLKIKDDFLNRKESFVNKLAAKIKSFFNL